MNVLDKGFVDLEEFMGGDLKVVNMARGSFGKKHKQLEKGDVELIEFMMKHRHGVPFEHSVFTFHVKCPISVAREWFRHRMSSFSEISGRYVQLQPEFYVPEGEAIRTQRGKPGQYVFEPIEPRDRPPIQARMERAYKKAYEIYENLLKIGVAKEVARNVLPVGVYTQFYWTVNARSLMNFLNLRCHSTAMLEIREYAEEIEDMFQNKMPFTYESFLRNGRVCP